MNMHKAIVMLLLAAAAAGGFLWERLALWSSPPEVPAPTGQSGPGEPRPPETDANESREAPGLTAGVRSAAANCTVVSDYLPDGDGTTTEVFSCRPVNPGPGHPYADYPTDALASLAYADSDAAAELSLRWRYSDEAAAMSMALRAAALAGGDATPIIAYSNAYPEPTAVNDAPVRKTVHVKYVLAAVTALLGDSRHSKPYFENVIRRHSRDPEREIALLQQRANELIEEMRQIQLDVVGFASIGG